jgi:hypothetical protein
LGLAQLVNTRFDISVVFTANYFFSGG